MRVLLSCGANTQLLLDTIKKKFESTGDELFIVEYIDNITEQYALGNYFDKAIITEQSITKDYTDISDEDIRRKISQFASDCAERGRRESYVFLTGNKSLAQIIYDESFEIQNKSTIVFKESERGYSSKFYTSLITSDAAHIPENIIFQPEVIGGTDYEEITDDDSDELLDEQSAEYEMVGDIGGEFQSQNEDVNDNIQIDTGEEVDFGEFSDDSELLDDDSELLDDDSELLDDDSELLDDNSEFISEDSDLLGDDTQSMNDNSELFNNESELFDASSDSFESDNTELLEDDSELLEDNSEVLEDNDSELLDNSSELLDDDSFNFESDNVQEDNTDSLFDGQFDNGMVDSSKNEFEVDFESGENGYSNDTTDDSEFLGNDSEILEGDDMESFDNTEYVEDFDANAFLEDDNTPTENSSDFLEDDFIEESNNSSDELLLDTDDEFSDADSELLDDYEDNDSIAEFIDSNEIGNNQNSANNDLYYDEYDTTQNEAQQTTNVNVQPSAGANNVQTKHYNAQQMHQILDTFAARGNSICVTGCSGSGVSTVAFQLANSLVNLGYTVLIVDCDTEGRTQNYISADAYNSMDQDVSHIMEAINGNGGVAARATITKKGLRLLTTGLACDSARPDELFNKEKISRFVNMAKPTHQFVIYDVPYQYAISSLQEIVFLSDSLLFVTEANTHGIMKTMLSLCNIAADDVRDTMFTKAQLVFNKYRGLDKLLGKKVKAVYDITDIMDDLVLELIGEDPGLYFRDMYIADIIADDPNIELGWFNKKQYTDTPQGADIFWNLAVSMTTKQGF